ncbi:MAG: transcriptional regulator with XRE-family HTH domain [Pseudoalteromonas distincta]|jgi:transcriptional regulator with XRE-family HTH domain
MDSANNIHINLKKLIKERGLTGTEFSRKSARYGGVSQKTISNITRDSFDPESVNIGVNKLDVIAKTLKVSPWSLIMPEDERDTFTREELEGSLKLALETLAEMEVIETQDYERLMQITDLVAAAQFSVLVKKEDSPLKSLVRFFVRKMSPKK